MVAIAINGNTRKTTRKEASEEASFYFGRDIRIHIQACQLIFFTFKQAFDTLVFR